MAEIEKRTVSWATMLKVFAGLIIAANVVIFAGFVYVNARQLGWTLGWNQVGIFIAALMINLVYLRLWNPELIKRRIRFAKFTKTWDKVWAALFAFAMLAIYVAAVIETRDRVLSALGVAWLLGLTIFILGWAVVIWSMIVNPYFEKTPAGVFSRRTIPYNNAIVI